MKKLFKNMAILLCIAAATMMVSCAKDYEDLIVGKWEWIHSYEDGVEDTDEKNIGSFYEFTSNGTLITYDADGTEGSARATYIIDGDKLTITLLFNFTWTIKKLTSKELILEMDNRNSPFWEEGSAIISQRVFKRV